MTAIWHYKQIMRIRSIIIKILILIFALDLLLAAVLGLQTLQNYIRLNSDSSINFNKSADISKQSDIMITELMSANTATAYDSDGDTPDWIEIYNSGDEKIDISGAGLTTNIKEPFMWEFPDIILSPGEYLLIYASGKDKKDIDGLYHTNFKLSKTEGETIYFVSSLGVTLSRVELPSLLENISYGYDINTDIWFYYNRPTPGTPNTETPYSNQIFKNIVTDNSVKITEYMTENQSIIYDEFGYFSDWIEITNFSNLPINISGYYLSDDEYNLRKWQLPEVILNPNEPILIFASGREAYTQDIHATFSLSPGETLTLSNKYNEVLDQITLVDLKADVSYGLADGAWYYFPSPTPKKANDTYYVDELKIIENTKYNLYLNEAMTKNTTFLKDFNGQYTDWVEIANPTGESINLLGYSISDKAEGDAAFIFSDVTIASNEYMLLFFSDEYQNKGDNFYIPFMLDDSGENLFLLSPEGAVIDEFSTGYQRADISCGLSPYGSMMFYTEATPGKPNEVGGYLGYSPAVEFSVNGGMVDSGISVSLTSQGVAIYYTLDGSLPTVSDNLYEEKITINSPTVIRAISVAEGCLPSDVATASYLTNASHTLPIVSISTEPSSFYGGSGIYDHPYNGLEKPVHIEIYEDNKLGISFDAGIEIFGNTSKRMAQKSFIVHLRNKYGIDEINYPLFGDRGLTVFTDFLLRTSGQDASFTKVRDSFVYNAVYGILDVDAMDTRACVVYVNGDYFGVYYFREKINENYIASHHDVDPDKIDLLIYNGSVIEGDNTDYLALVEYAKTHDLSQQQYYDYVAERVDIDEFINYLVVQCYFSNTDSGNIKYWRSQEGGKWRWIIYDMDWAVFNSTYKRNNIKQVFNPDGMGIQDYFSTTLHVNLMENEGFRTQFIETYAKCINEYFTPDRLLPILDEMIIKIEPEMRAQIKRWGIPSSYSNWMKYVTTLKRIIEQKPEIEKEHLQEFFGLSDREMSELFPQP